MTLVGDVVRDVDTAAASLVLTAADRAGLVRVEVRQRGTWAESLPVIITMGDGS